MKMKPCPYCGNPTPHIDRIDKNCWRAYCGVCSCDMPYAFICETLEEVIDAWNNFDVNKEN